MSGGNRSLGSGDVNMERVREDLDIWVSAKTLQMCGRRRLSLARTLVGGSGDGVMDDSNLVDSFLGNGPHFPTCRRTKQVAEGRGPDVLTQTALMRSMPILGSHSIKQEGTSM